MQRRRSIQTLPIAAPTDPVLTPYDHEHLVTYMRLLDADADGADWRDVSRIVLHLARDRPRRDEVPW
jgi:hypothetical protein